MEESLGSRIATMRERCGMQSQALARAVGLSPSAVSLIETGQRQVKARELALIADALGTSPIALLDSSSLSARLPLSARAGSPAVGTGDLMRLVRWMADMQPLISQYTLRPAFSAAVTDVDFERDWLSASRQLAQKVNAELGDWRSSPDKFAALKSLAEENLGIDVFVIDSQPEDFLGVAVTTADLPMIVLNAAQPRSRALFTLAHELGHMISCGDQDVVQDRDLAAQGDPRERFANAFAAELLLPSDLIRRQIDENADPLDALARLLALSGASWQTLVYRLHNLGMVNARARDELLELGSHEVRCRAVSIGLDIGFLDVSVHVNPSPGRWASGAAVRAAVDGKLTSRAVSQLTQLDEGDVIKLLDHLRPEIALNLRSSGEVDELSYEVSPA